MKGIRIASRSTKQETYADNMHNRPGGNGFISHPLRNFVSWILILICLTAAFGSVSAEESESRTVSEGDLITYYYNVSNIGNVNLTEVKVIDDRVNPIYISGDTNNDSWLNLSEIWLYKATYKVTKSDLNKDIVNIANVTATDPCGKPVEDGDIEIVKTAIWDGNPIQYGQFCEAQKIQGTGLVDIDTSIKDKKIALEYSKSMNGVGDIEIEQEQAYSEIADKLKRKIDSVNGGNESTLNLYESAKMLYSGEIPMQGEKRLRSKALYGGMGSELREDFSVQAMESDEVSFFVQSMPYQPYNGWKEFQKGLEDAGRDTERTERLMRSKDNLSNCAYLMGLEKSTSFNGTWGTDAFWHKIFYKDINAREMFTGIFEVKKQIKFHQYPVMDKEERGCTGIDC
jgi:hypothetical protein